MRISAPRAILRSDVMKSALSLEAREGSRRDGFYCRNSFGNSIDWTIGANGFIESTPNSFAILLVSTCQ